MKSYAIGLYEKAMQSSLGWCDKLLCAAECGFDFVEISIDETDERLARLDWSAEKRAELRSLTEKTHIPIRSLCLSANRKYPIGSGDQKTRERGMEIIEKAIDLADNLGVRTIQLAGYDVYYEQGTPESEMRFRENLKKAVDMAAYRGVTLAFETMETEFMNTVEKAMHYVNMINSPYLGVYPDCGNLTNAAVLYGKDVFADMEKGRGHIFAMHLKETVPGKFREIPFFQGHVDFPAVIAKAWELGVRRYVVEMWDVGSPGWKKDIGFAGEKLRGILDKMCSCEETDIRQA